MCRGVLTPCQGRAFAELSCDSRGRGRSARRTVQDGEWQAGSFCAGGEAEHYLSNGGGWKDGGGLILMESRPQAFCHRR